jgi:hypothetical protein
MQLDPDRHAARERLARQVLEACEKLGLRVWQRFGSAHVGRWVGGRLVPAPRNWERVVEALSYEIACLLDMIAAGAARWSECQVPIASFTDRSSGNGRA